MITICYSDDVLIELKLFQRSNNISKFYNYGYKTDICWLKDSDMAQISILSKLVNKLFAPLLKNVFNEFNSDARGTFDILDTEFNLFWYSDLIPAICWDLVALLLHYVRKLLMIFSNYENI